MTPELSSKALILNSNFLYLYQKVYNPPADILTGKNYLILMTV